MKDFRRWDITAEMIEIRECAHSESPKEELDVVPVGFYGHHDLFSWLVNVRGRVRPYLGENELVFEHWVKTREFIGWLTGLRPELKEPARDKYCWPQVLYSVDELLAFDYDQPAIFGKVGLRSVNNHGDWEGAGPHSDNQSYRQLFGNTNYGDECSYFEFLRVAKSQGWDFVIFSFDNWHVYNL